MADQCASRAPKTRTPDGWTVEQLQSHPTYRYHLEPTARCELDAGHGAVDGPHGEARRHRNGLLVWWDPPIFEVR